MITDLYGECPDDLFIASARARVKRVADESALALFMGARALRFFGTDAVLAARTLGLSERLTSTPSGLPVLLLPLVFLPIIEGTLPPLGLSLGKVDMGDLSTGEDPALDYAVQVRGLTALLTRAMGMQVMPREDAELFQAAGYTPAQTAQVVAMSGDPCARNPWELWCDLAN